MQSYPRTRMALVGALALMGLPQTATAQSGTASLEIKVSGLQSAKGVVRLAICPPQSGFPDCKDKAVHTASLPIENGAAHTTVRNLPAGTYAVSIFHDANANGKLDTFLGIPKEGYGFSKNPPFRPRAPKWSEAEIEVTGSASVEIKIRYIL